VDISKHRYHLAGVAGSGMSALAQVLLGQGAKVSGSDRHLDRGTSLDVLRKLELAGVRLVPQDGQGVTADVMALVLSTAVEDDNPDVLAARRQRVPILHRAELLARLAEDKRTVAVTGTSGKSTVTAMIGWILEHAGFDPVVVNGAPLVSWADRKRIGNVRCGGSNVWVVEADESDRSLLHFNPDYAVITNASSDHFSLSETRRLFEDFSKRVKGDIVSGLDLPSFLRDFTPQVSAQESRFEVEGTRMLVRLPGRHNAENALFAALLCSRLRVDMNRVQAALRTFAGIQRRLEKVGSARGVTVIDDYGHNPAKIRAAWSAVAPYYKRVLAVWRPHGYGPLAAMLDGLVDTFGAMMGEEDRLWILPVYDAGGTADRSISSNMLRHTLAGRGLHAAVAEYPQIEQAIAAEARKGDLVLVMGARDPELPVFARSVFKRIGDG